MSNHHVFLGEFRPSPEADGKKFGVPVDRRPYGGTKYTLEKMAAYIKNGASSPAMLQFAEAVVTQAGVPRGQRISDRRAAQIFLDFVRANIRYRPDPNQVEAVKAAAITLCVPGAQMCIPVGDCMPEGTLLLKDDYSIVPIEEIKVGDRIWGKDKWTRVEATKLKGQLSIDAIEMNNGSTMYLTPGHKVYVGRCKHGRRSPDTTCHPQKCKDSFDRVPVSDLHEGDVLLQPERVDFGGGYADPDRQYVEGLALADGWVRDTLKCFYVAGRDGMRKEKQKHEVKAICDKLGIKTRWHKRYIVIYDEKWATRLAHLGSRARFKHLETINLDETSAEAALRGLMVDSTANSSGTGGRTYSTTSPKMMLQVRVLHRMFGISTSVKMLTPEQHRGAGKHPLWRVGVRQPAEGRNEKTLAVRSIERDVRKVTCWDIQTEDHYVYLPEHDVTVSNCDDLTVALGSLMGAYGIQVRLMKQSFGADADEEHILVVFKSDNGDWLAADPSAPADKPVGWRASADNEVMIDPLDPSGSGTQSAEFVGIGKLPFEVTIMETKEKTLGAGFWPTWIYPSTVNAAKADLLATLQSANQTVASCTALPAATTASWTAFYNTVTDYAQPSTTSIWGLGGQMDQVQKYQAELYDWQVYLGQQRCAMTAPTTNPEAPLPPGTPSVWVGVAKLAALAAVLGAGAYGVSKVVEGTELFKAPKQLPKHVQGAASEARRLVRGKRRRSR